jgi:hypothetical protein
MLAVTPAFAITVTNQDKRVHSLTVDKGAAQADRKLAAGATVKVESREGCELRVQGSGYRRSVRRATSSSST